jgi:hypothetical protein
MARPASQPNPSPLQRRNASPASPPENEHPPPRRSPSPLAYLSSEHDFRKSSLYLFTNRVLPTILAIICIVFGSLVLDHSFSMKAPLNKWVEAGLAIGIAVISVAIFFCQIALWCGKRSKETREWRDRVTGLMDLENGHSTRTDALGAGWEGVRDFCWNEGLCFGIRAMTDDDYRTSASIKVHPSGGSKKRVVRGTNFRVSQGSPTTSNRPIVGDEPVRVSHEAAVDSLPAIPCPTAQHSGRETLLILAYPHAQLSRTPMAWNSKKRQQEN